MATITPIKAMKILIEFTEQIYSTVQEMPHDHAMGMSIEDILKKTSMGSLEDHIEYGRLLAKFKDVSNKVHNLSTKLLNVGAFDDK